MTKKGSGNKNKSKNKRKGRMNRRKSEEEFEADRRKENVIKGIMPFIIIVVIILLITILMSMGNRQENNTDYNSPYEIVGDEAVIQLSDITTSAKFFSYESGGKDVKFFAVIGSDGDVHTAFDSCDVCYEEKLGYYQDGKNMVCRNCGKKFTTNQIGTANQGGGCWPSYLKHTVEGGEVKIKLSDLNSGRYLFP